ncbi:peptidyl-prolyl cis-trans isomerase [Streptomyces sp. NPDC002888]|uniref:peptidylprolyl isomerase n=1 Tax=Streptomyces sp. NPDC002888 TaxID=3364668 RepID=UPI0036B67D33
MKGTLPRQGTSRKPGTARRPSTSRKPGVPRKAATARRPRTSRGPSRRAVVLFTGVCLALAALVVTGVTMLSHRTNPAEVASLDGHSVTRDELLFHMRRLAPTVQNELRNTYHLRGTFDWKAKAGGKTALQRLETRALDEIRRDKTTLVLAKEQGLVDSVDHTDFLADLSKENQSRADAIAEGRTVYGVAHFSPEEYYTHRLTELTTSLKKRLGANADGPLRVTEADVRHAFDADRDAWSANATTYRYTQLVVPSPADAAGLQHRVTAAGSLTAVAAEEPGAKLTTGTYHGTGSNGLSAHDQDLVTVLGDLAPGRISAPVPGTGQITFYQLQSRTVDEDKAFADYSQRIRQSLVEKKFDQLIQRRADDSDLDVDTSALDAINAEDVQQ